MSECNKKIKYLVTDITPFLHAVYLNQYAETIITVPDLLEEIKHKRQLRRRCVLPLDVQVREPRLESVKCCVEFAKKTGDYASLSGIDIKVIALAYELEADTIGTHHLRTEPILSRPMRSKEKPKGFRDKIDMTGWCNPRMDENDDDSSSEESCEKASAEERGDVVKEAIEQKIEESTYDEEDVLTQEELEQCFTQLRCDAAGGDDISDIMNFTQNLLEDQDYSSQNYYEASDDEVTEQAQTPQDGEVIEDGACTTPSNVKEVRESLEGEVEDNFVPLVACMSTDFDIQNVLKQMNLHVADLDGCIIKRLRTYIQRCYACFKTTNIMTKVFCPNCGKMTLKRVAVSLDENGMQIDNTDHTLLMTFENHFLPNFRGSRGSRNPILFEDQPISRRILSRVPTTTRTRTTTRTSALHEDYTADCSPLGIHDAGSRSGVLHSRSHPERARTNTYERERGRRGHNRQH